MRKLSITDLDLDQELVLLRVDFNVPLESGVIGDDTRIRATLPTLKYLIEHRARTVLCSHLGRPKGKPDARYSLRPVAEHLQRLLETLGLATSVGFCPQAVGPKAEEMAARLEPGHLLLLENLRYYPGEEKNDPVFARQLANLGEVYVNDAFGAAHRAHASTVGVTQFFPQSAAGFLLCEELDYLGRLRAGGEHPYVVILGGSKVSDKLPIIKSLTAQTDTFLIGGAMAYTFLKAQGQPIGDSLLEADFVAEAGALLSAARPGQFLLPVDHVVAASLDAAVTARIVTAIPDHAKAFDIGPATRQLYAAKIAAARMVFWNGPMGVFERPPLDAGTLAVARAVAACPGTTVAGGGDSVAALQAAGLADQLSHVSTGGGASLEYLAGDTLPGVAALTDAI